MQRDLLQFWCVEAELDEIRANCSKSREIRVSLTPMRREGSNRSAACVGSIVRICTFWLILATSSGALAESTPSQGLGFLDDEQITRIKAADVVIIGEIHPNPVHHMNQAEIVRSLAPATLVFEMVERGKGEAFRKAYLELDREALYRAIDARDYGWDTLEDYLPIVDAAPAARVLGAALERKKLRRSVLEGAAIIFGSQAAQYGLSEPLPEAQLAARIEHQRLAHCDAMPDDLLPGMVEAQRLLDATFARVVIGAAQNQKPVILITGNGHARSDWGVPHALRRAAPDLDVVTIGQLEPGSEREDQYDIVIRTAPFDQGDPCASLRN